MTHPNLSRSGHNQDTKNALLAGRLIQIAKTSKHLTRDVLDALTQGLEGSLNAVAMHVGDSMQREKLWEYAAWQERCRIEKTINHLIESGLVDISREGLILGISEKGQIMNLRDAIRRKRKKLSRDCFCLVGFDIPETKSALRKNLRRILQELGFSRHQRSLWVSQKDVMKELTELFSLMGIDDNWISIYEARRCF